MEKLYWFGNMLYYQDVVITIDAEPEYSFVCIFSWDFKEGQVKEWFWGAYWLGNSLSFINLYLEEGGRVGGNSALS